jgi:uncharacterized protein YrrD
MIAYRWQIRTAIRHRRQSEKRKFIMNNNIMEHVRPGMMVHTADGHPLGKVAQVWFGSDPSASSPRCDDERCSRIEVQRGRLLKRQVRYVPISAIADVATDQVTLKVDAAAVDERDWLRTPQWIAHMTGAADAKREQFRPRTEG